MKSHESILLELAKHIFIDAFAKCAANEPAERDLRILRSRVKNEGLSFLTITLPSFCLDFERSLADGMIGPKYFRSFRKYRRIPAFLRGIVAHVFDAGTGCILDDPSTSAVESIRQICLTFKKLKLACSPARVASAFAGFVRDERSLHDPLVPADIDYFQSVSSVLWMELSRLDNTLESIPKHGPGATAERISGNAKYKQLKWHERLEPYFPYDSFALSSINALDSEEFKLYTLVAEEDEQPVRLVHVPKTLKGPRIIAIEPVCMQYTQQALSKELVQFLESTKPFAGHVNFTNQQMNRALAMIGSEGGGLATLDLSSASDRVPLSLVTRMLDNAPVFRDAVLACRSSRAQLPSGKIVNLKKFASMGSALCFPIESMYFYTVCVAALLRIHERPVTRRNVLWAANLVTVYGDDLIVPDADAAAIADHLQKYYCKVNMSKSFWTGRFRESCGMDAFAGEEVTPTYLREMPPSDRRDGSALVSWMATSNLFYKRGYWRTSLYLNNRCEKLLGKLPIVGPECAGLGMVSFQRVATIERWSPRYQCPEVRSWIASPVYRTDRLDGYPALLKSLLSLGSRPFSEAQGDSKHLERTARHGAVTLKRRWTRPY